MTARAMGRFLRAGQRDSRSRLQAAGCDGHNRRNKQEKSRARPWRTTHVDVRVTLRRQSLAERFPLLGPALPPRLVEEPVRSQSETELVRPDRRGDGVA